MATQHRGHHTSPTEEALARAAEPMPRDARIAVRRSVMAAARHDARTRPFTLASHRLAAAITAVTVLGGGVAYASSTALPGQPLYAVKRAAEDVAVFLLPPGELERGLLVRLAGRRAAETADLAAHGATSARIQRALDELGLAVDAAASADGPLGAEEIGLIERQAEGAPAQTRDAITDTITRAGSASPEDPAQPSPDQGGGDGPDAAPGGETEGTPYYGPGGHQGWPTQGQGGS